MPTLEELCRKVIGGRGELPAQLVPPKHWVTVLKVKTNDRHTGWEWHRGGMGRAGLILQQIQPESRGKVQFSPGCSDPLASSLGANIFKSGVITER